MGLTQNLREAFHRRVGGYSPFMCWYRSVRPRWLWRRTSTFGLPTTRYVDENGLEVVRGPFMGLRYPARALGHTNYVAAKLIGCYEPEVLDFLGKHASGSDLFVDLGSGDGFFCVGVAGIADLRTIGFETNRFEKGVAQEMAAENGVRIEIRGMATPAELNSLSAEAPLVLCDIEGYEEELIDPSTTEWLSSATMVIELHEKARPRVVETLNDRFRETHSIQQVFSSPARPDSFPELSGWDDESASVVVRDGHAAGESWMMLVPTQDSRGSVGGESGGRLNR